MYNIFVFILSILVAFYVTWGIGANDVANNTASALASKTLSWNQCVVITCIAELIGSIFLGSKVIATIATEILPIQNNFSQYEIVSTMLAALISTGFWVQLSSLKGMPVSTTHAIVSAITGIGIVWYGTDAIQWPVVQKIAIAWVLSPISCCLVSMVMFYTYKHFIFESNTPYYNGIKSIIPTAYILPSAIGIVYLHSIHVLTLVNSFYVILASLILVSIGIYLYSKTSNFHETEKNNNYKHSKPALFAQKIGIDAKDQSPEVMDIFSNAISKSNFKDSGYSYKLEDSHKKTARLFRTGQVITSFMASLGHGSNDVSNGIAPVAVILWILYNPEQALLIPIWLKVLGGLGIVTGILTMGKRVIKTVGTQVITINPFKGFIIQLSTAITVLTCSLMGLPISTSHAIIGALVGVHLSNHNKNINSKTLMNIFIAWVVTVPICILSALLIKYIIDLVHVHTDLI